MKVQGLAKLLGFAKALETMPRALRQAEEATMRDWKARSEQGFNAEQDPYGNRWPRRKSGGANPVLTGPTKRLRRLKLVRITAHRWKIVSAHQDVLPFHQTGTSRMPRRRVFPDAGRLPKTWRQAGVKIHRQKLKEHFGR